MWHRFYFALVTLFFITMNVLLWRSEIGGRNQLGSPLPAQVVWQKILIAPDNSKLEIWHREDKIGFGIWSASVGEDLAIGRRMTEELPPEGMIKEPSHYSIDFDGNLSIAEVGRVRLSFNVMFSTNQLWEEFTIRLGLRPSTWEVRAKAREQKLIFSGDGGEERFHHEFTFQELLQPDKVLEKLGAPLPSGLLSGLSVPAPSLPHSSVSMGLRWEARKDWLAVGSSRMRVYRLQARLLDRYQAVLHVSLQGEILRVELPGDIVLVNDVLTSL